MNQKELLLDLCKRAGAQQIKEELEFIYSLLEELKPEKILEIGSATGGLTCLLAWFAEVVVVDINENINFNIDARRANLKELFPDKEFNIKVICGNSNDEEIRATVAQDYGLVIIDGDHTLKGGYTDWQFYNSMSRVIAVHDTSNWQLKHGLQPNGTFFDWFPTQFWYELNNGEWQNYLQKEPSKLLECPTSQGGWGVVFK